MESTLTKLLSGSCPAQKPTNVFAEMSLRRFSAGPDAAMWELQLKGKTQITEVRLSLGFPAERLTILTSSDSASWAPLYTWESVEKNADKRFTLTSPITATSVRLLLAGPQQSISGLPVLSVLDLQVYGCEAFVSVTLPDAYTYSKALTPIV